MGKYNEAQKAEYAKKSDWLKKDGKTVIQLNSYPATIEKAKELGWKKK